MEILSTLMKIFFLLFVIISIRTRNKTSPLPKKQAYTREKFSQLQKNKTFQSPSSYSIIKPSNTYLQINRKLKFLSVIEIKPVIETLNFPQFK